MKQKIKHSEQGATHARGVFQQPAKTIDELWRLFSNAVIGKEYPSQHSFENVVFAVDFLFAVGAVKLKSDGALEKCV